MTDDELLDALRTALAVPPVAPDERAMAGLDAALAATSTGRGPRGADLGTIASLRKMAGRRVSTLSVILVMSLVTGGAAAAAVATDTLPGPTRAIAWDLGLPVTSPGLYQARQAASGLQRALHSGDHRHATALGRTLERDLQGLDPADLSQVQGTADQLLQQTGVTPPTAPSSGTGTDQSGDSTPSSGTGTDQSGDSTTTTTLPLGVTTPGDTGSLNLGGSLDGGDASITAGN
ncbi:MAG: hypothetical protein KGJ36_01720 [Acidobacteriota bacterium]|nr:hypothetical protein [Acidobacteriota bacterium]